MTARIDQLGLTADELSALRHQGFVSREPRRGGVIFKLRFRLATGEQRVRYLGADRAAAAEVEKELCEMQRARRTNRALVRLVKEAGQRLRASKAMLAPALAGAGYRLHGLAVRRRRVVK
jgi:hypothetical protein